MIRFFLKKEDGAFQILQATIIYPICLFIVASFVIISVYIAQKANLQSAVDMTLIYYKNDYSDTFVKANFGNSINLNHNQTYITKDDITSPYRFFSLRFNDEAAKGYLKKIYDHVFIKGSDKIDVSVKTENYIWNKDIYIVATMKIAPQINLRMMGMQVGPITEIKASGMVRLIDGDMFVGNLDFIADLVSSSSFGGKLGQLKNKIKDTYDKYIK